MHPSAPHTSNGLSELEPSREPLAWRLPALVGILGLGLSLVAWRATIYEQHGDVNRMTQQAAAGVQSDMESDIKLRVQALTRLARHWEEEGTPKQEVWESEAQHLIADMPGFQRVEWVDPSLQAYWGFPLAGEGERPRLSAELVESRRLLFERARNQKEIACTHTLEVAKGVKGFLIAVPIFQNRGFVGLLLGTLRYRELFDDIYVDHAGLGYEAVVFDGDQEIFNSHLDSPPAQRDRGASREIRLPGVTWRLVVWPAPILLTEMESWASERTVLIAGLLVSFLFVLTTHQAQRARRWAKRIESVNTELRTQIAERKRAELGLRENEERFRSVFEKGPMGMAMIDRTFRFIKVNHAFCQMLGYTEEELMRMSFVDFTHPEDRERGILQAEQLFEGENSDYRLVKRYLTKSGDTVWVNLSASILRDDSGRPQWGLGIVENITDRLRAEEAMRSSEARLAGILDLAAEGVVSIDENQRITLFNHGAECIFGYTTSEILGLPLDVLLPERFRDTHREHVRQFANSPDTTRLMGMRRTIFGLRKDGTEFPAEGSISKLNLGRERVFTVILRDVTERKQAEEGLRRAHDELEFRVGERTAELAETNETLRTEIDQRRQAEESLHVLSGRLLNLQDEERRRIARELHDSTAQSVAAISVNLAMVQQAASTLDPHAVNALRESETLAEECLREIRNLSYLLHPPALDDLGLVPALNSFTGGFAQRSGIHVDLEVAPDFGRLPTEVETVLFRIVQESLTNAYRYSQSQTAQIHLERSHAEVTLEVTDQGIGIPPEHLDPSSGGIGRLGVGIAGMRARMRQLGGRLEIISNNLGTSVRATLPVTRCG